MLRQYPVQIYSTFKNQFPKMSFVQFDSKSSRISFELYNNIDDPMTDIIEAVATVQRSDGVEKTYGMTLYSESEEKDIPVFEISGNIVTFILPVSALYVKGRTYCQIYLYDSNYGRITIPTFTYEVLEQLVDDIPQDTVDSYPVLSNMLGSENTRITNEEERISAEQERISAESLRTSAETSRANAESARAAEYQQIKGIIMDENNAVNLQNQINFIDSSLNDKVNKLTRVYNFDEYGGIPEDSSKDNAPALNSLISSITQGSIIFLPSRSYYFSTPVNITGGRNIKIVGLGKDSVGGTRLFWTGTGFLFNFYGGAHCEIENLFIQGNNSNNGINFGDNTPTTASCRISEFRVYNVKIQQCLVGVTIDCPTGYLYLEKLSIGVIPIGGIGVRIGLNYTNTTSVLPGYIYLSNCNIDDLTNKQGFAALAIYGGQWIFVDKCDFCNFNVGYGVYMSSDITDIDDISITNSSIFSNLYGIYGYKNTKYLNRVNIQGNMFRIFNNGYGIVVNSKSTGSADWLFTFTITNNIFAKVGSAVTKIVSLQNIYNLSFLSNNCEYALSPVFSFCDFTNINGMFSRYGLLQKHYASGTVSPNSTLTLTVGGQFAWISSQYPLVVNNSPDKGTVTWTNSYDSATGINTITVTNPTSNYILVSAMLN